MKVLLTGASGQVGRAVQRLAPPGVELAALTHRELDIGEPEAVQAAVASHRPEVIINAAAYTAVDKAESEPELAFAINAHGARYLAQAAAARPGCRVIHISTDYVFDGQSRVPYKPGDATHPLSVYGRSKLEGETEVLKTLRSRATVLRTAWVYAAQGKNFVLTMLRLMKANGAVRVVADQHGSPTEAGSIARSLWRLAERPDLQGILHWTDAGETTWYGFACAIAEEAQAAGLLQGPIQVTPITTADYPTPARRPANSVLDTRESIARLGIEPEHWRVRLRATLHELSTAAQPGAMP